MTKIISFCTLGFILSLTAHSAFATFSLDAKEYTCSELKTLVQNQDGVIIKNWAGCDAYFAEASDCTAPDTRAIFSYTSSEDTMYCGVGYTCAPLYPQGGEI
jgi:hypothetical protein